MTKRKAKYIIDTWKILNLNNEEISIIDLSLLSDIIKICIYNDSLIIQKKIVYKNGNPNEVIELLNEPFWFKDMSFTNKIIYTNL
jgi:hypothetical protein